MKNTPLLAITLGDPAGIGPEVCVKAVRMLTPGSCRPVLIGDEAPVKAAMQCLGIPGSALHTVEDVGQCRFEDGTIELLPVHAVTAQDYGIGRISAAAGNAAFLYVKKAIELAMSGTVDGTVTAPLNKEALHLAGHAFAGHTEIYAHFTNCSRYAMLLAHGSFRLIHVSTHVSLREACDRVRRARVLEVIRLADDACRSFGIDRPRVGVAGLNPHCGEGGLFGREEIEEIRPAVEDACAEGIACEGPVPPDTVFSRLRGGLYDIVVAMYHDQGHIPIKLIGFNYDPEQQKWNSVDGVNITLGLPIVRVSVDHGTAFDIAGKGIASPDSMLSAIDYAARICRSRISGSGN